MVKRLTQPPPTYAEVILVDQKSKTGRFNPLWLKWFLDLADYLNGIGANFPTGATAIRVATLTLSKEDYTLTEAQANTNVLEFRGKLLGDVRVIVPDTFAHWLLLNRTIGNFDITFGTATGETIRIPQGFTGHYHNIQRQQLSGLPHVDTLAVNANLAATALTAAKIILDSGASIWSHSLAETNFIELTGSFETQRVFFVPPRKALWNIRNSNTGMFPVKVGLQDEYGELIPGTEVTINTGVQGYYYCDGSRVTSAIGAAGAASAITQIDIELSPSVSLTHLTQAQADYNTIYFTGALSSAMEVQIPNSPAHWFIGNKTTGGRSIALKPEGSLTTTALPSIAPGDLGHFYSDGLDIRRL